MPAKSYDPQPGQTGVYVILNKTTNKVYVGSSAVCLYERRNQHFEPPNRGSHCNRILQRSWNKHGGRVFVFKVIELCAPEDCVKAEQKWIDHHRAADRAYGYNLSPTAGSTLGVRHPAAARANMSASHVGAKWSEESRPKRMAALRAAYSCPSLRGKISVRTKEALTDPDVRFRMGSGWRGKKIPDEVRAKMSEGSKRHRAANPMTEETRRKIGAASAGRKLSSEHKSKIAAAGRGRKASPETRARISAAKKLGCADPAFREKMSALATAQHAARRAARAKTS